MLPLEDLQIALCKSYQTCLTCEFYYCSLTEPILQLAAMSARSKQPRQHSSNLAFERDLKQALSVFASILLASSAHRYLEEIVAAAISSSSTKAIHSHHHATSSKDVQHAC